eukprot:2478674-Prymnesium_polylepis.3
MKHCGRHGRQHRADGLRTSRSELPHRPRRRMVTPSGRRRRDAAGRYVLRGLLLEREPAELECQPQLDQKGRWIGRDRHGRHVHGGTQR